MGFKTVTRRVAAPLLLVLLVLSASGDAAATVTQVDGTIVPVLDGGTDCAGNLQVCLDDEEGTEGAIDAILDAQQLPEIFEPTTSGTVTFRDIGEGAGFENSIGYYNVGDDVTDTDNLHPILGCGVPAATHTGEAAGYVVDAEPGDTATIDFAVEQAAGRYAGGFIGFYLITPEARPDGATNCGDFTGASFFGRIYFTQRDLNNDGDFVHHLVYRSPLTTDRFYFGFEDLFRGGDNDFEDMAIQVTGLTPPCAPSVEICNGLDDDCDGLVDDMDDSLSDDDVACTCDGSSLACEGGNRQGVCQTGLTACVGGALLCRSQVSPSAEVCNGDDDNCDGVVDNNPSDAGAACDGPDADLCDEGVEVCTGGVLVCNDTTPNNVEVCNDVDDDCDTTTDEDVAGVGIACDGSDGDMCLEGVTSCVSGVLSCSDMTGSTGELCNGADDDCDGSTDESPTDVGTACSVGVGACLRNGATECTGGAAVCNVSPGSPSSERCNFLDDDCDGSTDETFMLGQACVAPGECGPGVLECAGATTTRCSTGPGGSADASMDETCNGLDDDCDGLVDEGLNDLGPCGSNTGECSEGRLRCLGAAETCVGGVGPIPETCNGLNDDCDEDTDEMPLDAGGSCGTDAGECEAGTEECIAGALMCIGATGPGAELCNGLDDDCDLVTDEAPTDVGVECGTTDVGVCDLGATICLDGNPVCAGATEPNVELCNGLDDDCDGDLDEDPIDVGRTCGSAMGTCAPGVTICVAGAPVCDGGTVGVAETCNGIDDDCDSVIDEDPSDDGGACGMSEGICEEGELRCIAGALECVGGVLPGTEVCNGLDDDCNGTIDDGELCEGGVCQGGRCAVECIPSEFGLECPRGETCVDGFCLEDTCFGVTCAPGEDGALNVCMDGGCVPVCDTLTCEAPDVCRASDGACVGNSCLFIPGLCADDERCEGGDCIADPCAGMSCEEGQFCRDGSCIGSCGAVRCGPTEQCRGGSCEATGCDAPCGGGEVCSGGACVEDPCVDVTCDDGAVCDPIEGSCVEDPCRFVTCPGAGETCELGECVGGGGTTDGGMMADGGTFDGGPDRVDVLAAGGMSCAASPVSGSSSPLWLGLLGLLFVRRRRRGARAAPASAKAPTVAALVLVLAFASGCEVDPFCLAGCDDTADGAVDGGEDGGQDMRDAQSGDACVPSGGEEECNEIDDDCDGFVDEDFDLDTDGRHCGSCDNSCALTGAQSECAAGSCEFLRCFDGFSDLNEDPSDGCEYRCFESNGGAEACDSIDNDCDGETDEEFDFDNDGMNCGRCGQVCAFFRVDAAACTEGTCAFDPGDCTTGFLDVNGTQSDGCEFECTPAADPTEICNGLDDDCDATTDEGFNLDADIANCGRCGRVCSFPNATPQCTTGTCGFNPATDCDAGFSDRDGIQLNGCEFECTPTADPTEICDGIDNDCDGRVDGATTDSGGGCNEAPGGTAMGLCTNTGTVTCVAGGLVCVGAPQPTAETCDGSDNDCDGMEDEDPVDVGRVCEPPVGVCSAGFTVCTAGGLVCEREVAPSAEVCNGLDDDCDGRTDEAPTDAGLGGACGLSTGECSPGVLTCTAGSLVCDGEVAPTLELCNGLDDDCDGTADDDPVDVGGPCGTSVGACIPGSTVCVAGAPQCSGGVGAGSESCNGQDDDCDGGTDEEIAPLTCYTGDAGTRGIGLCADGAQVCSGGSFGACAGQVLPAPETCDNQDNNCDGNVDEGVTETCYGGPVDTEGVGICRAGVRTCSLGSFGSCAGDVTPEAAETCDNEDDDCDGNVDEASGGGVLTAGCYDGTPGTAGTGTCVAGTQTCAAGAFGVCVGQVVDTLDRCGDALDTDCDGLDDAAEGCMTAGGDLRIDTGDANGATHSFDVVLAYGGSPSGRNVYALWADKRAGLAEDPPTNATDIYFSRSTDGGNSWSAPTDLTTDTGEFAVQPRIAVGRSGGEDVLHVAYQTVSGGGVRRVRVRTSTDSGSNFAAAQRLDTTGGTDNFKHAVATSADGSRTVVAWEQLETADLDRRVISRASTDTGGSWSAERLVSVNVGALPTAGEPVVGVTSTGRFVFVWREARPPTRSTFDVYATYSDSPSTAIPSGREVRLDGDTAQNRASDDLRIAVDGTRIYVAWSDVSTLMGGGTDIVFVRSTNGAVSWSTEAVIDDPSTMSSDSGEATLVVDGRTSSTTDDRVIVAWRDTREGTQVYAAVSNDSGASFAAANRTSQQSDGPVGGVSSVPQLVHTGGNSFVIAYVNEPTEGAARRVRAAVTVDGGISWQIDDPTMDTGGGEALAPAVARADGGGLSGAVIAWADFRAGTNINGDIYRARIGQ
ncbi:MAG: MopE-related protein [Sandaracinaceae bacterium]